jgi:hypothetical protein
MMDTNRKLCSEDVPEKEVPVLLERWRGLHLVRTVASGVAFLCGVCALAASGSVAK